MACISSGMPHVWRVFSLLQRAISSVTYQRGVVGNVDRHGRVRFMPGTWRLAPFISPSNAARSLPHVPIHVRGTAACHLLFKHVVPYAAQNLISMSSITACQPFKLPLYIHRLP